MKPVTINNPQDVKQLPAAMSAAELRQAVSELVNGLEADLTDVLAFIDKAGEDELKEIIERAGRWLKIL